MTPSRNTRLRSGFAALLLLAGGAHAQFPVQDMDARSLGFGYGFGLRGQDITDAAVSGNEVIHEMRLAYAPVPYVELQAGIGLDRFSVERYQGARFRGDYGFSPSFGLSLFSPWFAADLLRGTGGVDLRSFSSEDGRGFRYSGFVSNPFLGLLISPTVFLDVEVGARAHLMDGNMEARGTETAFANSEVARGYLALTLKTPFERSFLHVDVDLSPSFDSDWSAGPREAKVSATVGAILGWKGHAAPKANPDKPLYFPAYKEMKEQQDKMAEELE